MFSFKYVATILFNLLRLYEIFFILISSFINSFNKLITCCFSLDVGMLFFTSTFTLASTIGFLVVCDFISTVTFLAVSTSKSLSHGVKNVSSAITSKRILPVVFSSISPFNFLIGISHLPPLEIVPLNNSELSKYGIHFDSYAVSLAVTINLSICPDISSSPILPIIAASASESFENKSLHSS